jgi:hypothetical protein
VYTTILHSNEVRQPTNALRRLVGLASSYVANSATSVICPNVFSPLFLHSSFFFLLGVTTTMQSLSQPSSGAPQPAAPDPPTILVEDYTQEPTATTLYMCGDNIIDLLPNYKQTKELTMYPACMHRPSENDWPCPPCETAFVESFWTCAARLLDYFSDFFAVDTPAMQSVWFYLLDIWQEGALWLPVASMAAGRSVSANFRQDLSKALLFQQNYEATLELFSLTIYRAKSRGVPVESVVHAPTGEKSGLTRAYNTGPWVSGLTGWEQFLSEGAPGVAADDSEPRVREDGTHEGSVRYIPMAAIGIMEKHTTRARRLAATMESDSPELNEPDADSPEANNEVLDDFEQHCLRFPTSASSGTQAHTYTSLTGDTVSYTLSNGAPPISRSVGFSDPDMLISRPNVPTFTQLDDFVASCKGTKAYEAVSGLSAEDGGNEGTASEAGEERFDMWRVSNLGKLEDGNSQKEGVAKDWGSDMFDNWYLDEY